MHLCSVHLCSSAFEKEGACTLLAVYGVYGQCVEDQPPQARATFVRIGPSLGCKCLFLLLGVSEDLPVWLVSNSRSSWLM